MEKINGIKLFTVAEITDKLPLTDRTIRTYIKDGKIKITKMGRKVYISEHALNEYLLGSPQIPKTSPEKEK